MARRSSILDDLLDAFRRTIDRRAQLPPETTIIMGEPRTLSYDELQRTFGRLLHDEEWETREIPKALAKTGAWLEDQVPFHDAFIKPWMIDLADDHYELDITRARSLLGWEPNIRCGRRCRRWSPRSKPIRWRGIAKINSIRRRA